MVKQTKKPNPTSSNLDPPGSGKRGADGHIAYLLRQAQVAVRNAVEDALADLGVTLPQFSAMTMLDAYKDLSAADIARLSMLTPQTITVIVRNLERDGLISRTPDPAHGRILRLKLTKDGTAMVKKCRKRVDKVETRMVAGLKKKQERMIRTWLSEVASDFQG